MKVFAAQIGFFDTVVAAPSQAAALRAWGVRQNLFASGAASVTTDPEVITKANASPGVPLRRAVGSKDEFALDPASLPQVPALPKTKVARGQTVKAKPIADRSRLNAAEAALADLQTRRQAELRALQQEEQDLTARMRAAGRAFDKARNQAEMQVAAERKAFGKAEGSE